MSLDKKIISEIERYRNINNYILEQAAADLGALAPEVGAEGAGAPPPPAPAGATPPPAPGGDEAPLGDDTPQKIDVDNDPDVEKVDDKGKPEDKGNDEGDGTETLDVTDLVDSQKNIEKKQNEYFENLFGQIQNLESKLSEMDNIMNKLNALETKIEKYREKTPQEKLELRSLDSYPFNQKLSQFFDDKQEDMEKTGKHDYVLTPSDIKDININDIKNSFQPGGGDSYDNEFKR
jgi:hypothetical protein